MEMNPQMIEILKKAKAIDKAARKFDTGAPKKPQSGGLLDQMGGYGDTTMMSESTPSIKKDIGSENYRQAVTNSKLPPAIQKAMLENPIPQAEFVSVDQEAIRQLREMDEPIGTYNEEDEIDMYEKPVRRYETQQKRPIKENVESKSVDINESYLRKLIASEISKALPKIVEDYFDKRLVKENVQFKAGNTIFSGTVMPMPKLKGKNNI